MEHPLFPFRTSFQCVLKSEEQSLQLRRLFGLLYREGFYGAELNLSDLDLVKPEELKSLSDKRQVEMNTLAAGAHAKAHGLSLSPGIPGEKVRAANGCKRNIDYAASMGHGIIIGFLGGGPGSDREASERLFLGSMLELRLYIEEEKVQVPIKATNHKEASVTRTLEEGAHVINFPGCPFIQLLADTYHMNIEEPLLVDPLSGYMNYHPHLYISDNNRARPGLGSLDLTTICRELMECGYKGTVVVGGNIQHGPLEDTQICTAYLRKMCSGLHTLSHVPSHAVW